MATSKTPLKEEKPTKFERIYEDDECISIWRYDLKKTKNGPVEVEYRWKRSYNPWNQKKMTISEIIKQEKKEKRLKSS